MTYEEAKKLCRNPQSIVRGERFVVLNSENGEPLQTDPTRARAELSAQWCNEHELRCGRRAVYVVRELYAPMLDAMLRTGPL